MVKLHYLAVVLAIVFFALVALNAGNPGNAATDPAQTCLLSARQFPGLVKVAETKPDAAYFYVGDDKLPACQKWCYIDLTAEKSHHFLIPGTAGDLYKDDIVQKFKEDVRQINSKVLTKACMYIRFDPNLNSANASFIYLDPPKGLNPALAGYEIVPSVITNGEKDVKITDNLLLMANLLVIQDVDLQKDAEGSGAGLTVVSSGQVGMPVVEGSENVAIGITMPFPAVSGVKYLVMVPIGDKTSTGDKISSSQTIGHELVAHVLPHMLNNSSHNNSNQDLKFVSSDFDQHSKDSSGKDLPADNIAKTGTLDFGFGVTDQQVADIEKLCSTIEGQDNSPPAKSQYNNGGCGNGACEVGESSGWCPQDCGNDSDPNNNGCQWIGGKQDNSDGSKKCGGMCKNRRMVCNMGGNSGVDCGCRLCGNGMKDPGEQCESAADCPKMPGMDAICKGCNCFYKAHPK